MRDRDVLTPREIQILRAAADGDQTKVPALRQGVPVTRPLTPRQEQVLHMLAAGYSMYDVAARLFLSYETVRWHVRCIRRNLGVNRTRDAIELIRTQCLACGRLLEETT